jgi:outer membrane scaffolding protein for murein synthesis (MipA/OmpV family)
MQKILYIIILPTLIYSQFARAEFQLPKMEWEIGAALAALQIPLYPGSADHRQYLLPLPYVKVHSEFLDIDEGIRARLFGTTDVRLSMSADLGVPVRSQDSLVRKGMPNLDTVFQLGPLFEMTLAGSRDSAWELRFELPARFAFATDVKTVHSLGWIYEPRFSYQTRRSSNAGFQWKLTAGLRYASETYNGYYYDVPPVFAIATRPQFTSGSGYGGSFADVIASWREDELIYWSYLRYQNLSGAVFANSPLVEQKNYYFLGVGVTWIFAHSL